MVTETYRTIRTVWIIDGAYLMKAAPGRFDYLALRKALESEAGPIGEAYYLNSIAPPETEAQALERHTKGAEAAQAALETADVLERLGAAPRDYSAGARPPAPLRVGTVG